MIIYLYLGELLVKLYKPGELAPDGIAYPYLDDVSAIVSSTTQESGNAEVKLYLTAWATFGNITGKKMEIYRNSELVFAGIIQDLTIRNNVTCQLEA
jgi:hypothetical protein